ncbi:RAD54 [Symbiodinium sp. CCMP2592]|nr:RAD54 [Symbiodinium sp. CCMP2592]
MSNGILAQQFSRHIDEATRPHQFALSTRAGAEALAHSLQLETDSDPSCTVLSVDGIGAFDFVSRRAMLTELQHTPDASAMLPFVRLFYGAPSSFVWTDDEGVTHLDQPAFPAGQVSWRYAWSSENEEQIWLQERPCHLVWAQAPSLTALARTLVAAAFVEAKRGALMMTRRLLQSAAAESTGHSRCHVASTVAQLISLSMKFSDGADEASCIAVRQVWDELRQTLGTEAVLHSKFAPWGVLLFGLLHHLRGQIRAGPTHCRLASLREVCEPKGLAAVTAEGLRKAVAGRLVPSVPAIMAFLSEISTLCNRGVAAAHLALAQSLLLLTAQADLPLLQRQRKPLRAPSCQNGGFQSPNAEAWVSRLSRTQMEVVAKELPELSYAGLRIPMKRQNLSSFTHASRAGRGHRPAVGGGVDHPGRRADRGLVGRNLALGGLGWKFFACLTVIRPPPQIRRRGRFY